MKDTPLKEDLPKVVFLTNDPGTVNVLLPIIKKVQEEGRVHSVVISHPVSRHLYKRKGISTISIEELSKGASLQTTVYTLFEEFSPVAIVVGASRPKEGITIEQGVVLQAQVEDVPTFCVLDYWGDYTDRFHAFINERYVPVIPDIVCALDVESQQELIRVGVPPERIRLTFNPQFDQLRFFVQSSLSCLALGVDRFRILFVSQPLKQKNAKDTLGYDQETIFDALLTSLRKVNCFGKIEVVIWKHPLEDSGFWLELIQEHENGVQISIGDERGVEVLQSFNLVVSGFSTVFYQAVHVGVPCISVQIGLKGKDQLVTNSLGLSRPVYSAGELVEVLNKFDSVREQQNLYSKRQHLMSQKLFFSDGFAVDRVVSLIHSRVFVS